MEEEIKRKVFLEGLPNRRNESNKGNINWKESIGYKVPFQYSGIIGEVEIVNCNTKDEELTIKYENKEVKIRISNFKKCRLGKLLNKITSDFKIEIGQVFKDNKRDFTIIDREYRKDKKERNCKFYKYKCGKCNWDNGWIREDHLLNGIGCACCCPNPQSVVEGINDIPTTAPWMIPYFQGGYDEAKLYTKCSSKKIHPICPDCGRVKNKTVKIGDIRKYHSIGCNCSDKKSFPEKYMFSLLYQLKQDKSIIDFNTERRFDWCIFYNPFKQKICCGIYDFVIEENKLIIETDGGWHRVDNTLNGQTIEEAQYIDNKKDVLSLENGYKIIRVSDEEDIRKNILDSSLKDFFDLNNINWLECEKYATKNLVKEVCDYWHLHNEINNENLTSDDLGRVFKLGNTTMINYLKKGKELGWCNYNAKNEMKKNGLKSGKSLGKPVEILKDGQSLGVFSSCSELERQSEKLFGVKLLSSSISSVCNGKRLSHKEYTFKYIN